MNCHGEPCTSSYACRTEGCQREKAAAPLYAARDTMALGQHYTRHVEAMTVEGLHSKSAIAAELASRDALIADLRAAAGNGPALAQVKADALYIFPEDEMRDVIEWYDSAVRIAIDKNGN